MGRLRVRCARAPEAGQHLRARQRRIGRRDATPRVHPRARSRAPRPRHEPPRHVALDPGLAVELTPLDARPRSEEHTSELQSLMRISYAVFCLKKTKQKTSKQHHNIQHYN